MPATETEPILNSSTDLWSSLCPFAKRHLASSYSLFVSCRAPLRRPSQPAPVLIRNKLTEKMHLQRQPMSLSSHIISPIQPPCGPESLSESFLESWYSTGVVRVDRDSVAILIFRIAVESQAKSP